MKFIHNPLDNLIITQSFGERSEYYAKYNMAGHNGVDFRTKFSDTPKGKRHVYSVMDGVVTKAQTKDLGGYGRYVRIGHPDGDQTIYAHFHCLKVKLGDNVKAGQIIGISDNSGDSSGPHLHFGYRPNGFDWNNGYKGYIDPIDLFI